MNGQRNVTTIEALWGEGKKESFNFTYNFQIFPHATVKSSKIKYSSRVFKMQSFVFNPCTAGIHDSIAKRMDVRFPRTTGWRSKGREEQ